MLYYQSMYNKNFEENRQKGKHLSNPSLLLFCKFSHRLTLSRSSFIQTFFVNENHFFTFNSIIFFSTTPFYPKHVNFFQNIYFLKIEIHEHSFYPYLQRKKETKVSLRVSYSRVILQHGSTLSRVGFGSLCLSRGWMILRLPNCSPLSSTWD